MTAEPKKKKHFNLVRLDLVRQLQQCALDSSEKYHTVYHSHVLNLTFSFRSPWIRASKFLSLTSVIMLCAVMFSTQGTMLTCQAVTWLRKSPCSFSFLVAYISCPDQFVWTWNLFIFVFYLVWCLDKNWAQSNACVVCYNKLWKIGLGSVLLLIV